MVKVESSARRWEGAMAKRNGDVLVVVVVVVVAAC